MLQRSKNASAFPGYWAFPSGGIEETDASVRETVIREVKEETNLSFSPTEKYNFYESIADGKRYIALVHLGKWSGNIRIQKKEVSDWKFFNYKEAKKLKLAFAYKEVINDLYLNGYIK